MVSKIEIVQKDKKYMMQFPENVSSEKQAEYLSKVTEKLQTEQFVTIDPKIKVYATTETVETPIDVVGDDSNDTSKDSGKDKAGNSTDTNNETNNDKTEIKKESADSDKTNSSDKTNDKVQIEKVEIPVKEPTKTEDTLIEDNIGRQGEDGEE